jgi:hypothetical protein
MKQAFGIPVQQALEDVCDPSLLALLVYDMQIGIVTQLKSGGPVTTRVAHAADLGIVADACGAGHEDAAQRSLESLKFAGDAIVTDTDAFCGALRSL